MSDIEKPPIDPKDAYDPKDFYEGSGSGAHGMGGRSFDEEMWDKRTTTAKTHAPEDELETKQGRDEFFRDFSPDDFKKID